MGAERGTQYGTIKKFVGDGALHVPMGSEIGARNRGVEGAAPYDVKKKKRANTVRTYGVGGRFFQIEKENEEASASSLCGSYLPR